MNDTTILLTVSAEVLFHDGAKWHRLDESLNAGSTKIQLVKAARDHVYRIVATRAQDHQKIIDQTIFSRLKYKEGTPCFHQWRNEHKQVIGLNFHSEEDGRLFYSAVRQALDNLTNLQQQQFPTPASHSSVPKSQVEPATYQDPQHFHHHQHPHPHNNNNNHHHQNNHAHSHQHARQQPDIYASHQEHHSPYNNGGAVNVNEQHDQQQNSANRMVIRGGISNGPLPVAPNQNQQQQQNLIRRASQGSNISSSTGGSGQNALVMPPPSVLLQQQQEANANNCNSNPNPIYAPPNYNHANNIPTEQNHQNGGNHAGNAPPPPPPPPPDLKSLMGGANGKPSFADQLKQVQLRKNSAAGSGATEKPQPLAKSPAAANGNGMAPPVAAAKPQPAGNLISELEAKLNKRKMNTAGGAENSGNGQTRPTAMAQPETTTAPVLPRAAQNSTPMANAHKKVPSGSSLSNQEEAETVSCGQLSNNDPSNCNGAPVTAEDLAKLRADLKEMIGQECAKLRLELTQVIREEFAKLAQK